MKVFAPFDFSPRGAATFSPEKLRGAARFLAPRMGELVGFLNLEFISPVVFRFSDRAKNGFFGSFGGQEPYIQLILG